MRLMGRLQGRVRCGEDAENSGAPNSKHLRHGDPGRAPSLLSLYSRLERRWNDLQVGRQGKYSVERLESLDHYCKTTSHTRVVLVCVLTPLPALMTTILLECLPLRSPAEGWAANWVFWLRLALTFFVCYTLSIAQTNFFIPDFPFTLPQKLVVGVGVTTGYIGFCCTMAHFVGFPVPFTWQAGAIPTGVLTLLMLVLVLGRAPFARDSPLRPQFQRFKRYFFSILSVMNVYPVVQLLYNFAPVSYRGVVVLLVPFWKFGTKRFVMLFLRDLEDYMPGCVTFIVDFFSAIFLSVCMYNSGSITTSAVIIVSDVAQTLLEFREVRMNANLVLELLQKRGTRHDYHLSSRPNEQGSNNLVTLILAVCQKPDAFNVKSMHGVRLWACLAHPISDESLSVLSTLESQGTYGPDCLLSGRTLGRAHQNPRRRQLQFQRAIKVVSTTGGPEGRSLATPTSSLKVESLKLKHPKPHPATNMSPDEAEFAYQSKKLVVQGLQLLFHCEYLTLVEYVECVVPLVFVAYKSVLHRLPNVVYYHGGAGSWGLAAVVNILVFSMLEVASFLALNMLFQRKFVFSPLYQLAFVLETQMYTAQTMLFVGIVSLVDYELVHLGGL